MVKDSILNERKISYELTVTSFFVLIRDEVAILSASGTAAIINTTTNVSGGGESSEGEGVGSNVNKDHKRNDSFTGVVQLNPANVIL